MHAHTPNQILWSWPFRYGPPLAFSVAEMSGPKRPRPKMCSHITDFTLSKGLDETRSFHFAGMRGVFKLKIQQLHIIISASIKYTDQTAQFAYAGLRH